MTATSTPQTTAENGGANSGNNENEEQKTKREYNDRWFGYLGIVILSLANFAAVSIVENLYLSNRHFASSVSFGSISFALSLLILAFDRVDFLHDLVDLKELANGKVEGYLLLFFVLLWSVGVAVMTRTGGIAYESLNIYFSSWLALGMSVYTLNEWSQAKEIISIKELTRLSLTLGSWYALLISSLIVVGAGADAFGCFHKSRRNDRGDSIFAVVVGSVSSIAAFAFILVHYRLVTCCKHGGASELAVSIMLNFWLLTGVAVITGSDGIAPRISGPSTCSNSEDRQDLGPPGSNLFIATWAAFISSCFVTIQWKAAKALQFAKTQDRRILEHFARAANDADLSSRSDVDDI